MLTRRRDWNDWPAFGFGSSYGAFEDFRREMDRVLSNFGGSFAEAAAEPQGPSVSVKDTGAAYVLRAYLPGVTEKNVDLTVNATTLSLRAERKADQPEGYSAHRLERSAFKFSRSYDLPSKVDPERAQAALKNGVLTLTVPKAAEAQPKRIEVKAS